MGLIKHYYKWKHPGISDADIPKRYQISVWGAIKKITRKWFSAVLIPTIPFSNIRVACYRLCGYKIGEGTFIGMRCYLDDVCYDKIEIGKNVTISYGCFFACHGEHQTRNRIIIRDGAYIGMRCNIIAPDDIEIGESALIGAGALVNKSIPAHTTAAGVPVRIINNKGR